ncbi:hypothetical protein ABPG72_012908 [Tetrahymena utriculariae]
MIEDKEIQQEAEVICDDNKNKKPIGDRMKEYEQNARSKIDPSLPAIMRIDGHSFSKFTKGLKKPYDEWLHKLMVETTAALISEFNFTIGYTQSDEITLVYLPSFDKSGKLNDYPYANQIMKLVSLSSAFATNYFTRGILRGIQHKTINLEDYQESTKSKLQNPKCYFDSRIFNVPSIQEVFSNIYWRSCYDCIKNSVSMVAYVNFPVKVTDGLHTQAKIKKLLDEKNIDWNKDFSNHFKYGTFIKKRLFEIELPQEYQKFKKANSNERVTRTETVAFSYNFSGKKFNEDTKNILFEKYIDFKYFEQDSIFKLEEVYTINIQ